MGLSEFQLNELSSPDKTSGLSDFQIKSLSSYTKDILSSDKLGGLSNDDPLDLSSFKITTAGLSDSSSSLNNDPFFDSIKMADFSSDGDMDITELTLDSDSLPSGGRYSSSSSGGGV